MIHHNSIKKINSEKIEQAIADFEKDVDFEFIPVIAEKSSYVAHITWMISLLLIVLFIGLIDYLFATLFHDSWMSREPFYIAAPFVAFLLGWFLDKSDRIDRFFIPKLERSRQAQEKAELIFYRRRLHELKSRNALMLYISVMEKQIVLLPDPNMKFDKIKEINQELLSVIQSSFKKSDYEQGLLYAIAHLKTALVPYFARSQGTSGGAGNDTSDDASNNYPNKLIWWKD